MSLDSVLHDTPIVVIVWVIFGCYAFYSFVFNYVIFPEKARSVFGKDCDPLVPTSVKHKYLISIFVDNWSKSFNISRTILYMELITKQQTKMISFSITGKDIINKRAYLLFHRRKPLRPLTRVRMIHDCPNEGARIHLSAIKIQDMKYGITIYYSIDRNIYYESMVSAPVHNTLPINLELCSEHIFGPNFIQLRTDTYSTQIVTSFRHQYVTNGVILTAELNGKEDLMFVLFLMISLIFFDILFVITLKRTFEKWSNYSILIVGALLSSGLSFNSVNISALFYRKVIKTNYNIYCAPQLIDEDKESLLWTLYKNLSLTYLVVVSFIISCFLPEFMHNSHNGHDYLSQWLKIIIFEITDPFLNDLLFLTLFFITSLVLCFTLWLIISGLIKYLFLKLFAITTYTPYETIVRCTDDTSSPDDSGEDTKTKPDLKSSKKSNQASKLHLGTERLENELKEDRKNKKLMTGSRTAITPTSNPLGFVDPEKYRLGSTPKAQSKSNSGGNKE